MIAALHAAYRMTLQLLLIIITNHCIFHSLDSSYIFCVKVVLGVTESKSEQTAPKFTLDKKIKVATGKDRKEAAECVLCGAKLRNRQSTVNL